MVSWEVFYGYRQPVDHGKKPNRGKIVRVMLLGVRTSKSSGGLLADSRTLVGSYQKFAIYNGSWLPWQYKTCLPSKRQYIKLAQAGNRWHHMTTLCYLQVSSSLWTPICFPNDSGLNCETMSNEHSLISNKVVFATKWTPLTDGNSAQRSAKHVICMCKKAALMA